MRYLLVQPWKAATPELPSISPGQPLLHDSRGSLCHFTLLNVLFSSFEPCHRTPYPPYSPYIDKYRALLPSTPYYQQPSHLMVGSSDVDPTGQSTIARYICTNWIDASPDPRQPPLHSTHAYSSRALLKWRTHGRFTPIAPGCRVPRLSPFLPISLLVWYSPENNPYPFGRFVGACRSLSRANRHERPSIYGYFLIRTRVFHGVSSWVRRLSRPFRELL